MKRILHLVLCLSINTSLFSTPKLENPMKNPVQHQTMPGATFWKKIAAQERVSIQQVRQLFIDDVQDNINENASIPKKASGNLRIMTFNVRMWTNLSDTPSFNEIAAVIASLDPDILMLQEVTDWSRTYAHFINAGYNPVAAHCATQNPPFCPVIFAKNVSVVHGACSLFTHQHSAGRQLSYARLDATINGTPVALYTTHLEVDRYRIDDQGIATGTEMVESLRQQQIEEILADIQTLSHNNVIISGDFNTVRMSDYQYAVDQMLVSDLLSQVLAHSFKRPYELSVLDYLRAKGFKSSFELIGWQGPKTTNWAARVLDFIFFSPSWPFPVTSSYVYHTAVSDHLPVIADIRIN